MNKSHLSGERTIAVLIFFGIATLILVVGSSFSVHDADASTKKKYKVQILFENACTCTRDVTIKLKDGDGQTIAKRSVDISHLADVQDDSDIDGPKISVTDKKDQHPSEVVACMTNSHVKECRHLSGSGKSFTVLFNAEKAGESF